MTIPRILVTNDDGIHAPGLATLTGIARTLSDDVWVVAPEMEQSGAGHSLTLQSPLRFQQWGEKRFSVRGTPTDCVLMAVRAILPEAPTLVLSGINQGGNIAEDITHSGTIAAAMEGTLCGIPSIAFSQLCDFSRDVSCIDWRTAEAHAAKLVQLLHSAPWEKNMLYNVNFPACAPEAVAGLRAVPHGRRTVPKQLTRALDPKGRAFYWLNWADEGYDSESSDADIRYVQEGYITVTPISINLTEYAALARLKTLLGPPS